MATEFNALGYLHASYSHFTFFSTHTTLKTNIMVLCGCFSNFSADDELAKEVEDSSAQKLSYVGRAAYDALKYKHAWHHKDQWNVTSGKTVGSLHQTPTSAVFNTAADPEDAHCDWFPVKMAEIMSKTTTWCDLMSLGPPDGIFLTKIKDHHNVIYLLFEVMMVTASNAIHYPRTRTRIIVSHTFDLET